MNPRRSHTSYNVTKKRPGFRLFTNRALSLQALVILAGLILIGRLFQLQVIKHSHYRALAIAEQQKKFIIPATRGSLYFRDGDNVVPAALNTKVYTLYAEPRLVSDKTDAANLIHAVLGLNQKAVQEALEKPNTAYSVVAKRLSKEQVDKLFAYKNRLKGINVQPVPQRVYPEGTLGAQLLGFVNDEGVGQYGVEGALNQDLKGQSGLLKAITDVSGVPLSVDDMTNIAEPSKNGTSFVMTVDRNVQAKAEEALASGLKKVGATKGSVIVLDPNTGAIRAMANLPTYNPSKYFEVSGQAYERFRNRIVSDPYEAGSVIKVLTMATGLDSGAVKASDTYQNSGVVQVDDATIKNALQDVNGTRTMTDVLKYSLNTGVVHVLKQLGGGEINLRARERLYDYFTKHYGLGSLTEIDQSGEVPGSIFGPKTEQGNNVRYANMSFGQGMNVTMIQVASAFAAVVNGGNYYRPHVIEGEWSSSGTVKPTEVPKPVRSKVVSPKVSAEIRNMTQTAIAETPALQRLVTPGYRVGGKSGTSQIIDPTTGRYTDKNAIGTYLGYGMDSKPRYVIMVRVDDAKLAAASFAGSEAAAPIFGELNNWLLQYYNIRPK